jgi:hypothetical protein
MVYIPEEFLSKDFLTKIYKISSISITTFAKKY